MEIVDLTALDGRGPAWGTASEELNATLLVWRPGEGQPEHVNEGRDVAIVVLAGSGVVTVDGAAHDLRSADGRFRCLCASSALEEPESHRKRPVRTPACLV